MGDTNRACTSRRRYSRHASSPLAKTPPAEFKLGLRTAHAPPDWVPFGTPQRRLRQRADASVPAVSPRRLVLVDAESIKQQMCRGLTRDLLPIQTQHTGPVAGGAGRCSLEASLCPIRNAPLLCQTSRRHDQGEDLAGHGSLVPGAWERMPLICLEFDGLCWTMLNCLPDFSRSSIRDDLHGAAYLQRCHGFWMVSQAMMAAEPTSISRRRWQHWSILLPKLGLPLAASVNLAWANPKNTDTGISRYRYISPCKPDLEWSVFVRPSSLSCVLRFKHPARRVSL